MRLGNLLRNSRNLDTPAFIKKINTSVIPEMKTKGLSLAEQFIAEGHEKGLEKGLEQGRHHSLVTTLDRLLTRRFGELPEYVRFRLRNASIAELEALTDAILDAPSLHSLFPED